jgi:lipid-A-disaccharide synthase
VNDRVQKLEGEGSTLRLFVVAGEASGDLLGAEVLTELFRRHPALEVRGMGGPALAALGMRRVIDAAEVAVVGLVEVLQKLPILRRAFRRLEAEARAWRPHALLLIDFPDFNLKLARALRPLGVPIIYYVSPQIWAWRRGRIRTIARLIDQMIVIFPFEASIYQEAGVPVRYVGHPLLDRVAGVDADPALGSSASTVALLPGSRPGEVRRILPALLSAAEQLSRDVPNVRFLLARAPGLRDEVIRPCLERARVPIQVVNDRPLAVLRAADAAWVASGTATLEAALLQVPMVVVYKVSWMTYLLARLLIRGVSSIGMVNLVAGRRIVPERIQWLSPAGLAEPIRRYLEEPTVAAEIRTALREVAGRLGERGASARAAEEILAILRRSGGIVGGLDRERSG